MTDLTLDNARELLGTTFGFDDFRAGQGEVISALLQGRSAAAIFPTGSGKSLCYQLPALMLPGLTLVISPLIALMKDQIDGLTKKGVAAERLDSSLSEDQYRQVTSDLRQGKLKMLFVAPERLSNERFLAMINGIELSLLAVDEAHCISSWGHNFRPDYLKLSRASKELGVKRVLALTATATPQVCDDMAAAFDIASDDIINTGFHRPNLELRVTGCSDGERMALLTARIKERAPGPTIIYVSLQRHAEDVARHLSQSGLDARPYHAGLKQDLRGSTQDDFMAGRLDIVCATIAFGMGVDKSDIRYVYHYHQPKGFESYIQETGRAGRDGKPSVCELFACPDDLTVLENFVYGDTPDAASLRSFITDIAYQGPDIDVSTYELSRGHDIRNLVVNTLLTRLELSGIIRSEGFYYGNIRYTCADEAAVLAAYPAKQTDFLRKIFASSKTAKIWSTLDMDEAKATTGFQRDVIFRALGDLEDKGHIKMQLAGYRQRFRRLVDTLDIESTCQALQATFDEHEGREIQRIRRVLDYATLDTCLTAHLLKYFGEALERCGHCGVCIEGEVAKLPERTTNSLSSIDLAGFDEVCSSNPSALARPRQQARFLCGMSSPAVGAVRGLRGNRFFAACENVPFAELLAHCEQGS